TITAVDDPPVAGGHSYSTLKNTALTVDAPGLLAYDSDVDSAALAVQVVANATHGTVSLNPNGAFTYTPAAGYHGPDSFPYRANDGQVNGNTATISIRVDAAPVAVGNSYLLTTNGSLSITGTGVLGNDSDGDTGDTLTAVLVANVGHGTLSL